MDDPHEIAEQERERDPDENRAAMWTVLVWVSRLLVGLAGTLYVVLTKDVVTGVAVTGVVLVASVLVPRLPRLARLAAGKAIGDPRQFPSRLLRVLAFLFILLVVVSVAFVLGQSGSGSDGGTSSYWLFNIVSAVVENPVVIIGAALFLYYRAFGLRRSWAARQAADTTGWLVETVKQLSDEVRSMTGSAFVIVSSDDTRKDIERAVDDGLDASITGDSHDRERPDFYASLSDVVDVDDEQWLTRADVTEGATDAHRLATSLADSSAFMPTKSAAVAPTEPSEADRAGLGSAVDAEPEPEPLFDDDDDADIPTASVEDDVPWGVTVKEELHSLWLSLSASVSKGRIYWELGVPYLVAAWLQLVAGGFWVQPLVYLVVLGGTSPLAALGVFWVRKRIQDRRISTHRTSSSGSFWTDAGARVKVVAAPDVTAYVGQTAGGRTYASYDREEFVSEFSQRLWEMTREHETLSPSILEQYARNLKQMKPNLHGHLQNTELVAIRGDIADTIGGSQDEVLTKSRLAYEVIEGDRGRLSYDLGHDPKLVAEVFRQKVEESHELAEVQSTRETPDGSEVTLTLVYPTTKTRLPDMTELHSRFSRRFMGVAGEPIYELPDVDPREDLQGHAVPVDTQTMIQSAGALPPVGG
ncbi:hypothetical protein [Halorubellus sp. PRR65]|uniref:hypothetical protein n=1 Tax=Halorubellus sp. PRR65 TaxID=3098148 RepID=UPI002B2600E2|nr:hypothetical protein [Halorubellus sp. PRR65]